jgi:putative addiction module component (TIGR02574 family)
MTVEQAIADLSSLSPPERIRVVQAVWNDLAEHVGLSPSPAIKAELDRRWTEYESDPKSALTEEQFRTRIDAARGR